MKSTPTAFRARPMENEIEAAMGRASDDETVRLVVAFLCIMEPAQRAKVLALVERFARESPVVDGYTHFLMLDGDAKTDG